MSTTIVSSPKKKGGKANAAKWDGVTKVLLDIFDEELWDGNRPSGVFSKNSWKNIIIKFKMRTNLNYNKDQLKNRQDNLRCKFTKWEKLIAKETGLGWDNEKKTLSTPDSWWLERAKEDPNILKYKDGGPLWLDLMQKVFGGTTANGFHTYIPEDIVQNPLLSQEDCLHHIDDMIDFTVDHLEVPEDQFSPQNCATHIPSPQPTGTSKIMTEKRRHMSDGGRLTEGDKFSQGMDSFSQSIREQMNVFSKCRPVDDADIISYKETIALLKGVPGLSPNDPHFMKGVKILEDKIRRIAFAEILELGTKCVLDWIDTFH